MCLTALAALIGRDLSEKRPDEPNPDKDLLEAFLKILPSSGTIRYIDEKHVADVFERDMLRDLQRFVIEWDCAECEFQNKGLEKKRKKLLSLGLDYLNFLALNTWEVSPGFSRIPAEWPREQLDHYRRVVERLDKLVTEIVRCHQDLVRMGRKKLKSK